jgi:hypothetical protein
MDLSHTLNQIEILYRRVLDLTLRQETCLQSRDITTLSSLLTQKVGALAEAQKLRALAQNAGVDWRSPAVQEQVSRVASVLAELVEAEERCLVFAPPATPTPPRRQVAAAYGHPPKR